MYYDRVGPLEPKSEYTVKAAKDGYILREVKDKHGFFTILKLAEINILVSAVDDDLFNIYMCDLHNICVTFIIYELLMLIYNLN